MTTRELDTLSKRCGLQRRYTDGIGNRRVASTDAVLAVLRAMSLDIERPEDARAEFRRLEAEDSTRPLPPVVVRWQGDPLRVPLSPSASVREAQLTTESGDHLACTISNNSINLPADLPPGIHSLRAADHTATLLHAPRRCYQPRDRSALAIFLPLYAAHADHDLGVGSYTDLARLADWAEPHGADLVGTLPLLSTFLDDPFEPSPYAPVSRCVFSELYIDLRRAATDLDLPSLRTLLNSDAFAEAAATARAGPLVDYRATWTLVRQGLEAAAGDAHASDTLRDKINAFAHSDPLIAAYADFRAALPSVTDPAAERRLYLTAQYLIAQQLSALAADRRPLYLDLPVGAHGEGFDARRFPDMHARGVSLGAPPDLLFQKGQSWGFPPLIPRASRAAGHALFIEAVERHLRLAGALRIDHAAGLFRCFWAPDHLGPAEGVYVGHPADEYLAILSILSHRHRALIIGENLGTIPREVNRGLKRRGISRMSIAQFEMGDAASPLPAPDRDTLAALNTHDTPTFQAWWTGADAALHRRLGIFTPNDAESTKAERAGIVERITAALRERGFTGTGSDTLGILGLLLAELARHRPRLLLVNLEDLWLEPEPQNVPGIAEEYPAWRRRAARDLPSIESDPEIARTLRSLRALLDRAPERNP